METQHEFLMEAYFQKKDVSERNKILNHLLCNTPTEAKDFFYNVFKKERYLDMKLSAVRGYAVYASEAEVNALMNKLLELLKKIPDKTPYAYGIYEPMRSVFLMPYLIEHYDYECFHIFNRQLEQQYNSMPDCFKNIFTLDELGNLRQLKDFEEVRQTWNDFWGR